MAPCEQSPLDYFLNSYDGPRRSTVASPQHTARVSEPLYMRSQQTHNPEGGDRYNRSSGCEYCKNGYNIVTQHKGGLDVSVSVDKYGGTGHICVNTNALGRRYSNNVVIKYCPMCGKKL